MKLAPLLVLAVVHAGPALACRPLDSSGPDPMSLGTEPLAIDEGLWFRGEVVAVSVIRVDTREQVPTTTHRLGDAWVVLPEPTWPPGATLGVFVGGMLWLWPEVGLEPTPPESVEAFPRWRSVWNDIDAEVHEDCAPIPSFERESGVRYGVCGSAPLVVVAVGDEEPPHPAFGDGQPWQVVDRYGWTDDDRDGTWAPESGEPTVWFGALDALGRFGGWTRDDLPLPPPGYRREDHRADGLGTGTPTGMTPFTECPGGAWVYGEADRVRRAGVTEGQGAPGACATGGGAGAAPWWLVALAWRRPVSGRAGGWSRRRRNAVLAGPPARADAQAG